MRQLEELEPILNSNTIPLMNRFSARPVFLPVSTWIFVMSMVSGYQLFGAWVLIYMPFGFGFMGLSLWMVSKFRAKVYINDNEVVIVSNTPFAPSEEFRYNRKDVGRIGNEGKYVAIMAQSEHKLGYGLSKLEMETFYRHLITWHAAE